MSRSLKKGPFISAPLKEKIDKMNLTRDKKVIRTGRAPRPSIPTWSVTPSRSTMAVSTCPSSSSENMVGHRLGEFAPTRHFRGHGTHTEKSTALK